MTDETRAPLPETGKRTGKCGAWAEGLIEHKYCDLEFGHPGPHSYQRAPAEAASAGDTPRPARPVMSEGNLSGWSVYVTSLERYIDQLEGEIAQAANMLHDGLGTGGHGGETLRSIVQRAIQKHGGAVSATPLSRDDVLEEAALVAEDEWISANSLARSKCAGDISRAIRALKGKPAVTVSATGRSE